ncbi:MAG: hypothetical protein HAW61_00610 [Candidatus Portiera sp.]|nr:hypothetical protein [Portiera sp.]
MSIYIQQKMTGVLSAILLIICLMPLIPTPAMADDWGFSLQGSDGTQQLELTYSIADDARSMREWYFGCRQLTLSSKLSGLTESNLKDLKGSGCGVAFSWRYFFKGGYFTGVRNSWWNTSYKHLGTGTDDVLGNSRVDSLAPSFITGWKLGNDKFSADIFIGIGREFNLFTEGEKVDSFNTFSGGITLRF